MLVISFLFRNLLMLSAAPFSMVASSCQDKPAGSQEKVIYYRLGETEIPIHITDFGKPADFVCINLHDNESTSVGAARNVLPSFGGLLIRIQNKEQRLIRFVFRGDRFAFDPNRMFSYEGILASLRENGDADSLAALEVEKFAKRVLALVPAKAKYIIALHNNTNGAFSAESYRTGGDRAADAKDVVYVKTQDPDNFMLFTDKGLFKRMKNSGFNLILQDNENAARDGSLSVFCGENEINYVNIETEQGDRQSYEEMLWALLDEIAS
jgi:hypothetical protein